MPFLKLTNKAPENQWLEDDALSFWVPAYFQWKTHLLVSGSVIFEN